MRQCFTKKHPLSGGLGLGLLLLLFAASTALGQVSRTISIGEFRYFIKAGFSDADVVYPHWWAHAPSIYSGHDDDDLDMLHAQGVCIGLKRTWTDPIGVTWDHQIAMANEEKFADIENVIVPVGDGIVRTYRNPYPTKTLDGKDWTPSKAAGDPVDASIPADVVIYSHSEAWPEYGMGIDIKRWDYGFAHEDYDDFMISEYLFTNTSTEARDSVYFALRAETSAHEYYNDADIWGNYYGVTYWKYAAGDATADSMRIWYSWDANDKAEDPDTKGRPDGIYGNFKEPQYMSFVVIHADKSPSVEIDDPRQPVKAGWSQRDLSPDLSIANHPTVYKFISEPWDKANVSTYATTVDSDKVEVPEGMYRILRDDKDVRDYDLVTEQEKSGLFSFGPYQMAAGEDVRIVVAFAGGTIPLRWAIDLGAAYKNGYAAQLDLVPLPYDIVDPFTGDTLVHKGETLDAGATPNSVITPGKEKKDQVIDLGKKFAFANAAKAIDVWNNATTLVRKGVGDFGIPLAPAIPSLTGTSENDQIRLQWGNEAELDTKAGTIAGYRIYRDFKWEFKRPQDTTFYLDPLKDEDDLLAGTFEYVEEEVARGQDYYYYITAVTTDGVESSPFLNMTGTSAERTDQALSATRTPATATWQLSPEDGGVVVVPNPYHASGDPDKKYPGRKLNFLNLPAYANIHIYTVTGDRVQTLEHVKGTGDKDWERQDTFSTMEIVSGVYIAVVEELDAAGGSPTGNKVIRKFVVVK